MEDLIVDPVRGYKTHRYRCDVRSLGREAEALESKLECDDPPTHLKWRKEGGIGFVSISMQQCARGKSCFLRKEGREGCMRQSVRDRDDFPPDMGLSSVWFL